MTMTKKSCNGIAVRNSHSLDPNQQAPLPSTNHSSLHEEQTVKKRRKKSDVKVAKENNDDDDDDEWLQCLFRSCGGCNGPLHLPPPLPSTETVTQKSNIDTDKNKEGDEKKEPVAAAEVHTKRTIERRRRSKKRPPPEVKSEYIATVKCQNENCDNPWYHLSCSSIPIGSRLYRDAIVHSYARSKEFVCAEQNDEYDVNEEEEEEKKEKKKQREEKYKNEGEQAFRPKTPPPRILLSATPPLPTPHPQQQQPSGTNKHTRELYLCPKCDVEGTSRYLLEYFEDYRRQKITFYKNDEECVDSKTGCDFVEYLLNSRDNVESLYDAVENGNGKVVTKKRKRWKKRKEGYKQSEVRFECIEHICRCILPPPSLNSDAAVMGKKEKSSSSKKKQQKRTKKAPPRKEKRKAGSYIQSGEDSLEQFTATAIETNPPPENVKMNKLHPSFFVGKPVRLYNKISDSYHMGRIVDWKEDAAVSFDGDNENSLPPIDASFNSSSATSASTATSTKVCQGNIISRRGQSKKKAWAINEPSSSTISPPEQVTSTYTKQNINTESSSPPHPVSIDHTVGRTQYLIRFRYGIDGRKVSVHQWVYLEEHPLTIGISLVWVNLGGTHDNSCATLATAPSTKGDVTLKRENSEDTTTTQSRNLSSLRPAQIVVRTALEMAPVRVINTSNCGRYRSANINDAIHAMAFFFGRDFHHAVLRMEPPMSNPAIPPNDKNVNKDAVAFDFHHVPKSLERSLRRAQYDDKSLALGIAMACMELEEQRRARVWHGLTVQLADLLYGSGEEEDAVTTSRSNGLPRDKEALVTNPSFQKRTTSSLR